MAKTKDVVGDNTKPQEPQTSAPKRVRNKPVKTEVESNTEKTIALKASPKRSRKPTGKKESDAKKNIQTDGVPESTSFKVTGAGVVVDKVAKPKPVKKAEEKTTTLKPVKVVQAKVVGEPQDAQDDVVGQMTKPHEVPEIKSKYEKAIESDGNNTGKALRYKDGSAALTGTFEPNTEDPATTRMHIGNGKTSGTTTGNPVGAAVHSTIYDSLRLPNPTVPANPQEGTAAEPRDLTPNMLENTPLLVPVDMTEGGSVAEMTETQNIASLPKPEYFVKQPISTIMKQILEKADNKGKLLAGEGLIFDNARIYNLHQDCMMPQPHPLVLYGTDIPACMRTNWIDGVPDEIQDKKILHFRLTSDGGNRDGQMRQPIVCELKDGKTISFVPADEQTFPFGDNCAISDTDKLNGITLGEIKCLHTMAHPYTAFAVQLIVEA